MGGVGDGDEWVTGRNESHGGMGHINEWTTGRCEPFNFSPYVTVGEHSLPQKNKTNETNLLPGLTTRCCNVTYKSFTHIFIIQSDMNKINAR